MAAVRHLEFYEFHFWSCDCRRVRNLPTYTKISSKYDDFLRRYGVLTIFKMAVVRHLEFEFSKFAVCVM